MQVFQMYQKKGERSESNILYTFKYIEATHRNIISKLYVVHTFLDKKRFPIKKDPVLYQPYGLSWILSLPAHGSNCPQLGNVTLVGPNILTPCQPVVILPTIDHILDRKPSIIS